MALLAACGGDDGGTAATATLPKKSGAASGKQVLGAGFADGYASPSVLVPGVPQRLPLVVFDAGSGTPVREGGPDSFEVAIVRKQYVKATGATGGSTTTGVVETIVATSTVQRHATGIPTPYYPFTFTPPEAGEYEARAAFSSVPMPFKVGTRDEVKLVQIGEALRPVRTPTTADARGVDPICTRSPKPCPFHAVTLTDALAAKKPTIFVISTPGFCQTAICGPVLELLVDLQGSLSRFQIVHAEVYVEPNKKTSGAPKTTEAVQTYGLDYEPSLFVADAGGIVRARLDFSWDRTELETAVATVA